MTVKYSLIQQSGCCALGSKPGWGDVMAWQQVSNATHSSVIAETLDASDGQIIFASILVSLT